MSDHCAGLNAPTGLTGQGCASKPRFALNAHTGRISGPEFYACGLHLAQLVKRTVIDHGTVVVQAYAA